MTLIRLLTLAGALGWTITQGSAPHYRPGLMAQVAERRGMAATGCMVSSPTLGIGAWVYVYGANTGAIRYCRVTDTSQARDRERHIRTGRAVELSHSTALALCGAAHINDPPERCPVWIIAEDEHGL